MILVINLQKKVNEVINCLMITDEMWVFLTGFVKYVSSEYVIIVLREFEGSSAGRICRKL